MRPLTATLGARRTYPTNLVGTKKLGDAGEKGNRENTYRRSNGASP